jgi:hypothetical protein
MAAASNATLSPPPGSPPPAPTSPVAASPAPPRTDAKFDAGQRLALQIVSSARQLSKQFPSTSPMMTQINDLVRDAQMKMTKDSQPGEAQAPPVTG